MTEQEMHMLRTAIRKHERREQPKHPILLAPDHPASPCEKSVAQNALMTDVKHQYQKIIINTYGKTRSESSTSVNMCIAYSTNIGDLLLNNRHNIELHRQLTLRCILWWPPDAKVDDLDHRMQCDNEAPARTSACFQARYSMRLT
jgi:hypothetical protein